MSYENSKKNKKKKISQDIVNFENKLNNFNELLLKELLELKNDLKNIKKNYEKIYNNKIENKKNGINKLNKIPLRFKEILNIKEDFLSRTKVTKKVYEYIKKNNLLGVINLNNKIDNRIIKLDENLINLLNLNNEEIYHIKKSNDCKDKLGLNIYTLQKFIKKVYDN